LVKGRSLTLFIILILAVLPVLLFWQVVFAGKTLLPVDNLFVFEPWRSFAGELGVSIPHNQLLSDLILENYAWKHFIVESIKAGRLPLWNPYLFAGVPFLAAGQHSALYPFSLLFYIMPLAKAYGYFTVLQLFLAGLFMYIYARVIGVSRLGATVAAITYMLSAFMVVSVVFPMIIAAAAWLPLLLAMMELIIRHGEGKAAIPYTAIGGVTLGLQILAGHVEITIYVLLIMVFYAACRLASLGQRGGLRQVGWPALWLTIMIILGLGLGAVQLIPLYELVRTSFRQDSATYQQVIEWAYPARRLIAFLIPDFFGNPSHHSYFDVFSRRMVAVTRNYYGHPIDTIYWGIKNYVEGGSYVGILPLLLAVVAIWGARRKASGRLYILIFTALALISLAFVFGTPLYALLYYGVPGIKQLHSPFRWIFPYTLSVAVLAGLGADRLDREHKATVLLGQGALGVGLGVLAVLALSLLFPDFAIALAEKAMLNLAKAPEAFADGRMFFSYQFCNLLIFGLKLAASGGVLLLGRHSGVPVTKSGRLHRWKPLALIVLAFDLLSFGYGFNPAVNPKLLDFKPPVVKFLQSDPGLFRITTFDTKSQKPFIANAGMFYDLSDIRGYDSIIPKQYTDYMSLIEEQGELQFNRVARLRHPESLDSPLLDLLNVKYVLTLEEIDNPKYTLVYDGEVRVYRNEGCMPRAFALPESCAVVADDVAEALRTYDPRRYVILEQQATSNQQQVEEPASCSLLPAIITSYTPNQVLIDVELDGPGFLILADSYFPGWKAFYRPQGRGEERELEILRADGNFRAVELPAGRWTVRFKYTPMSFKLGLFVSFVAVMILVLLGGYWLWGRLYSEAIEESDAKRVAKNTLAPIALQLMNKTIETAFAALMLRILGPTAAGKYYFAVTIWMWLDIFTTFGLNILLQREVAKDHTLANRYLTSMIILRLMLIVVAAPLLAGFIGIRQLTKPLARDTIAAIALLAMGLIPASMANGFTAAFNAFEKMEYPALVTTVSTVLTVTLGTLALFSGLGFVGLAGVSILVNVVTAAILLHLLARHCFRPRFELDLPLQREMVNLSWPLMLNNLLSVLFFKIDVALLESMQGNAVVGLYSVAYKFMDALNVIPASFTIAIFPLMSRYAAWDRDSLRRAYLLSVRLLVILALPIALLTTLLAKPLVYLLGGSQYLPDSRIALQLMIWSIPIGFINSVTNYVLIALNQQRFLTRAFAIGLAFTIIANLIFIPIYSYQASALIHLFSELALFLPFYYCLRRHLAPVPWARLIWRPALSAGLAGGLAWLLRSMSLPALIPLAGSIYLGGLALSGTFTEEDKALLRQFLPHWRVKPISELPEEASESH